MDCPQCGSTEHRKDGFVNGRQRYKCKHCHFHYTVTKRSGEYSEETKQFAVEMYLEGVGFRAIGRLLKVSNTAVLGWVKQAGQQVKMPENNEAVDVIELDEMYTFTAKKKHLAGFG